MEIRSARRNKLSTIDCEINHPKYGWIPFTASPHDPEQHGREIYAAAMAGDFGEIAEYVEPIKTAEEKAAEVRAERDDRLKVLDVIVSNPLRWDGFSIELKGELSTYRQALLDVPQQSGFPDIIVWPEMPEA